MNISYLPLHRPKILLSDLTFGIWNNNVLDSLKTELSNYLGEFTVLTGSGRVAIKIALTSLGIGSNDEVIIPGFICSSVGEAVLETGATPVLADIGKDNVNIDASSIETLITQHTKAIITAHIFGIPAQIDKIVDVAKIHNIPLIEDCCQAFGARFNEKLVGTIGSFGIFSFGISKNIAVGNGGAICCQEQYRVDVEKFTKSLIKGNSNTNISRYVIPFATPFVFNKHVYGIWSDLVSRYSRSREKTPFSLYESNMNKFEAMLAIKQLDRYQELQELINDNVRQYQKYFKDYFKLINTPTGIEPAYLYFPIFTPNAKKLKNALRNKSIEVKNKDDMHFFVLYESPEFVKFKRKRLVNAEQMENEYLLFPVGYQKSEIETICKVALNVSRY